jgi:hypothetical protein
MHKNSQTWIHKEITQSSRGFYVIYQKTYQLVKKSAAAVMMAGLYRQQHETL